jgi:exosome complex RNA-binding protein Rrp4
MGLQSKFYVLLNGLVWVSIKSPAKNVMILELLSCSENKGMLATFSKWISQD